MANPKIIAQAFAALETGEAMKSLLGVN